MAKAAPATKPTQLVKWRVAVLDINAFREWPIRDGWYKELGLAEYGHHHVGNAIVANTATIRQKPDMIRRFLDATLRGYNSTKSSHNDALGTVLKRNADVKRGLADNQLKASVPLWGSPFGAQTQQQRLSSIDLIAKYAKLDKTPNRSDTYANDLVPKR